MITGYIVAGRVDRTTKPLAGEEGTQLGELKEHFRQLLASPANVRLSDSAAESFRIELATYEEAVLLARTLAGYRRGWREVENDPRGSRNTLARDE